MDSKRPRVKYGLFVAHSTSKGIARVEIGGVAARDLIRKMSLVPNLPIVLQPHTCDPNVWLWQKWSPKGVITSHLPP